MSNIEHLIENAIGAIEHGHDYQWWLGEPNKTMLRLVKSPPEEIWEMALYCYYTYREHLIWKVSEELEEKYGYSIPE